MKGLKSMAENDLQQLLPPRKPIAIVRLSDLESALEMSHALLDGGISAIEFTLTNPQANEVIAKVRREYADRLVVGAGTILDAQMARESIQAGAQFLVTPVLVPDVIEVGKEMGIPVVCGAFTPTEMLTAWRAGAPLIKLFPAGRLGASYVKDVLAPLPQLRIVPTGGVNLETCKTFLDAGAYTVAIGSSLVSKELINKKDWPTLTELARRYVEACSL